MKVFIDECVAYDLLTHLTGHDFTHIADTTLRGMKNGALLPSISLNYDVFLTTDKNIRYQQNLKKFSVAFVIMRPLSNDIEDLLPLVPGLLAVLGRIAERGYAPGDLYEIAPEQT